jgi:formylglycine-generating enzyme required for sulfatase activity
MHISGFGIARSMAALALALAFGFVPHAHAQNCAGDLNGDGAVNGADLGIVLANWGVCPPNVTQVSPLTGSVLGGTVLSITGGGLSEVTAVTVGGAACTQVTVLSPTLVRATTPAGAAGQAAIRVIASTGTTLAPQPFSYVQQQVASIVPNTGSYTGGTVITITGQYLAGTTGVTIGGVPCTNVVAVSATQVTAVTPAGSVGAMDVVISGSKGTITVPGGFTYRSIVVPSWATLVEAQPDSAVVTDPALRAAIAATGLAWRVRDTGTQIEMMLIPPGTFQMGCIMGSNQYECSFDEQPVHQVTLTNAFYLGRYEVTQAQWVAKMGSNPSYFVAVNGYPGSDARPVERVSWTTIQGYLGSTGFRLPTEAEWEYACRAGTQTPFYNGSTDDSTVGTLAWFALNAGGQTHAVGGKAANAFGLHDMLGNVWEWVNDWFGTYPSSAQTNPAGPVTASYRLLRGGAWDYVSDSTRSSFRCIGALDFAGDVNGFRVARTP